MHSTSKLLTDSPFLGGSQIKSSFRPKQGQVSRLDLFILASQVVIGQTKKCREKAENGENGLVICNKAAENTIQ